MQLPFLTNSKELQPGDLLVLPFDGGIEDMCCEGFPPIEAISHNEAISLKDISLG